MAGAPDGPTVRVMALHALAYCERLFYLEEVEEIRVADAAVWAGRRLHEELAEEGELVTLTLESAGLGIRGKLDAVRRREGGWYPIEHKRGRARRDERKRAWAWESDVVQVAAYGMLLEEHLGEPVREGRVRYDRDGVTVRVPLDDEARERVVRAVARAGELSSHTERPPVTADERRCVRCSLAPVCLPEEARFAQERGSDDAAGRTTPVRLFPPDLERRSLHVVSQGAKVGRSGEALRVYDREAGEVSWGIREISDVVVHGHAQVTTQALRLCVDEEVPVHFVTGSGAHIGTFAGPSGGVQRRIRQYRALSDDAVALGLARRLTLAKVEGQLRHVLRGSRKSEELRDRVAAALEAMRVALRGVARAEDRAAMMGAEGAAARAYFGALAEMVVAEAGEAMRPRGRSRRPPRDRFNALLSFGYGLLHRDVMSAVLRVGLEPAFGMLHQPRSAAWPLVLDLVELFRVPVVDMAVLGAVNRRTFDAEADFAVTGAQVWLSDAGRAKAIALYERRKHEEARHPAIGYTLSYARMMELEVRLLEKAWSGEPDLFATYRVR